MNGRKQKISKKETYPQKNRTTSEGYVGGQTYLSITENNLTDTNQLENGLLEMIVSPANLNKAYLQVKRNKGAAGVDNSYGFKARRSAHGALRKCQEYIGSISKVVLFLKDFINSCNIIVFGILR